MITGRIETLSECLEEIKLLLPSHWEELAMWKDRMPLAPQYDNYWQRETLQQLRVSVLRDEGKVIGYWVTFIAPGLHYGETLTATTDILWVHPDYRGNARGKILYDVMRDELVKCGVQLWIAGSKNHKQIEWFLAMLGFEAFEMYFSQWIGK